MLVCGMAVRAQTPAGREGLADLPGVHLWFTRQRRRPAHPWSSFTRPPAAAASGSTSVRSFEKRGYRVITYDRRGYGRSVADSSGPQPGTGADDLNALMDYLKIDRFHLVGTAAGGFVAWDYALSFPKRLRSLVVANSIGGVQDAEYPGSHAAAQNARLPGDVSRHARAGTGVSRVQPGRCRAMEGTGTHGAPDQRAAAAADVPQSRDVRVARDDLACPHCC